MPAQLRKPFFLVFPTRNERTLLPGPRQAILRCPRPERRLPGRHRQVQEWLGSDNIATTRIYDHRKTRAEDSPTFKVDYYSAPPDDSG